MTAECSFEMTDKKPRSEARITGLNIMSRLFQVIFPASLAALLVEFFDSGQFYVEKAVWRRGHPGESSKLHLH
jgi:hypothetical protein